MKIIFINSNIHILTMEFIKTVILKQIYTYITTFDYKISRECAENRKKKVRGEKFEGSYLYVLNESFEVPKSQLTP